MELKPLRVSELNQYIKRLIISDPILYNISVEGEISNFKHHQNGHMYFTIKDETSKLKCIMFSDDNRDIDFSLGNGDYIYASGYISVYDREGTYQLYVKKIRKKGIGELYESLQILKKKLKNEGLFDDTYKKELPFIPKTVGVITSSTGAVVRDIVTTVKRRMKSTEILIYQVTVQGEKSEYDICRGIDYFNEKQDIDVIIVARGGGSIEELWAFNKERVARAISSSKVPIISAVGHETDFTISDFVADKRASTPSVAGEIVVPSGDDLNFKTKTLFSNLLKSYKSFIDIKRNKSKDLKRSLDLNSPVYRFEEYRNKVEFLLEDLTFEIIDSLKKDRMEIDQLADRLNTLSPLSTLERGFSIITNSKGKIINSTHDAELDENISIILKDGSLEVKIIEIESKVKKNG